jgi:hypothetical protein
MDQVCFDHSKAGEGAMDALVAPARRSSCKRPDQRDEGSLKKCNSTANVADLINTISISTSSTASTLTSSRMGKAILQLMETPFKIQRVRKSLGASP